MNKFAWITLFWVLTGCASEHFYTVQSHTVSLVLNGKNAESVLFASSLDGFILHEAVQLDDDTWEIRVPADNEFEYFYVVDGNVYIPPCNMTKTDDFGSENCIYSPGM